MMGIEPTLAAWESRKRQRPQFSAANDCKHIMRLSEAVRCWRLAAVADCCGLFPRHSPSDAVPPTPTQADRPDSRQPNCRRRRRPVAALPMEKRHAGHRFRSCDQRRDRTIDARIFSTTESPARREKAEDPEEIFPRPTKPPHATEPIPNLTAENRLRDLARPTRSTTCLHRDRTVSEPSG